MSQISCQARASSPPNSIYLGHVLVSLNKQPSFLAYNFFAGITRISLLHHFIINSLYLAMASENGFIIHVCVFIVKCFNTFPIQKLWFQISTSCVCILNDFTSSQNTFAVKLFFPHVTCLVRVQWIMCNDIFMLFARHAENVRHPRTFTDFRLKRY